MPRADIRTRGLDGRDTEALDLLLQSRGWQLVEQRLDHELAVQLADLERSHTEVETAHIRGQVKMLRLAKQLPAMLQTESKKGKRDE